MTRDRTVGGQSPSHLRPIRPPVSLRERALPSMPSSRPVYATSSSQVKPSVKRELPQQLAISKRSTRAAFHRPEREQTGHEKTRSSPRSLAASARGGASRSSLPLGLPSWPLSTTEPIVVGLAAVFAWTQPTEIRDHRGGRVSAATPAPVPDDSSADDLHCQCFPEARAQQGSHPCCHRLRSATAQWHCRAVCQYAERVTRAQVVANRSRPGACVESC